MKYKNQVKLVFPSRSQNESFARSAAALFAAQLDPTMEEINDIKAAVSEAVTNCIVHAYTDKIGNIEMTAGIISDCNSVVRDTIYIKIKDRGVGISDIKQAMTPLYTSKPENERAGLGFAVMDSFMDKLAVRSKPGFGTSVTMTKKIGKRDAADNGKKIF